MSVVSKIRDAVKAPVLVRMVQSAADTSTCFDIGGVYWLPASRAHDFIGAGLAVAIVDPDEITAARLEISKRDLIGATI